MDLALNNLQRLICHKTQQTNKPTYILPKETVMARPPDGDTDFFDIVTWRYISTTSVHNL